MTAQFTPGPWEIVGQDDHSDVDRADDCVMITGQADAQGLVPVALIYTVDSFYPDGGDTLCGYDAEEYATQALECRANAGLMIAAPDLYWAAQNALRVIQGRAFSLAGADEAEKYLKDAIAKAETLPEFERSPLECSYCEVWADFNCDKCEHPICQDHTVAVAPQTYYCTDCAKAAGAQPVNPTTTTRRASAAPTEEAQE